MLELIQDRRSGRRLEIVILTLNEEQRIENILRYYSGPFDLILLDGGSTDQTVSLALTAGATIYRRIGSGSGEAYFTYYANTVCQSGWCFYQSADELIEITELETLQGALQTRYAAARCNKADWMYGYQMRTFNHIEYRGFRRGCARYDPDHLHESLQTTASPAETCPQLFALQHFNIWSVRSYFGKTGGYTSIEIEQFRRGKRAHWRYFRRYLASLAGFPLIKLWREPGMGLPRATFWMLFDLAEAAISAMAWLEQAFLMNPEAQHAFYAKFYATPTELNQKH